MNENEDRSWMGKEGVTVSYKENGLATCQKGAEPSCCVKERGDILIRPHSATLLTTSKTLH